MSVIRDTATPTPLEAPKNTQLSFDVNNMAAERTISRGFQFGSEKGVRR